MDTKTKFLKVAEFMTSDQQIEMLILANMTAGKEEDRLDEYTIRRAINDKGTRAFLSGLQFFEKKIPDSEEKDNADFYRELFWGILYKDHCDRHGQQKMDLSK